MRTSKGEGHFRIYFVLEIDFVSSKLHWFFLSRELWLSCLPCLRWILWMIKENFKKWNRITVEDRRTFPVDQQWQQCDLDKARIVPWTCKPHQNTVYWCNFKARSEERIAISSNTITRNRSLRYTAFDLCWESGMHEDWRWTTPPSISLSKGTSKHAETEFAEVDSRINRTKTRENP